MTLHFGGYSTMFWTERGVAVRDGNFLLPQMFPVRRWGISFPRLFIGVITGAGKAVRPSREAPIEVA